MNFIHIKVNIMLLTIIFIFIIFQNPCDSFTRLTTGSYNIHFNVDTNDKRNNQMNIYSIKKKNVEDERILFQFTIDNSTITNSLNSKVFGLQECLQTYLPDVKKMKLKQFLSNEAVCVNDIVQTHYNHPINMFDTIKIKMSKDKFGGHVKKRNHEKPFDIVLEDDNLLIADFHTIYDNKINIESKLSMIRKFVNNRKKKESIYSTHEFYSEIDFASGIFIFTKSNDNKEKLRDMWNQFGHSIVFRIKEALKPSVGTIEISDKLNRKLISNYRTIESNHESSLIELSLETCYKNQLLMQLKHLNLSLHSFNLKDSKSCLPVHIQEVRLTHPINKKELIFRSKIPLEYFQQSDHKVIPNIDMDPLSDDISDTEVENRNEDAIVKILSLDDYLKLKERG